MVATALNCSRSFASTSGGSLQPAFSLRFELSFRLCNLYSYSTIMSATKNTDLNLRMRYTVPPVVRCSESGTSTISSAGDEEEEEEEETAASGSIPPTIKRRRRRRYRKQYPGENKGISEEMRFVAMRLRNSKPNVGSDKEGDDFSCSENNKSDNVTDGDTVVDSDESPLEEEDAAGGGGGGEIWQPSVEGFLNYLVDSKLVFHTIERIVDESSDVSYAYFRKTGLERSEGLLKDIEWFSQQDIVIPEPSHPGVTYVKYLEELAEKSPPLFLCHFYNIYFSHLAGGQVIAKRVTETLLEGRELEFYRWEGEAEELLRGLRQQLNMLGEHWSRDEKNKCLRETKKAFKFLGQIVRLIIL